MRSKEILRRFMSHAPDEKTANTISATRRTFTSLANYIVAYTPVCREQSIALTKLEEALFWTNAAISRPPEVPRGD